MSPVGDRFTAQYGPIGEWDVSRLTDTSNIFRGARSFNHDVSEWDVSRVNDMEGMFRNAESFNQDLSKWDVSRVTDMDQMFNGAKSFDHTLRGKSWVDSKASKDGMFTGSFGSIFETGHSTSNAFMLTHLLVPFILSTPPSHPADRVPLLRAFTPCPDLTLTPPPTLLDLPHYSLSFVLALIVQVMLNSQHNRRKSATANRRPLLFWGSLKPRGTTSPVTKNSRHPPIRAGTN